MVHAIEIGGGSGVKDAGLETEEDNEELGATEGCRYDGS